MAHNTLPDLAYIREALDYDRLTGLFQWRTRPLAHFKDARIHKAWNSKWAGKAAGCINWYRKVVFIRLERRFLLAHRIAWIIVHDDPGPLEIDHIDGDSLNNRIANLRVATSAENGWNMRTSKRNQSGAKGIWRHRNGRYRVGVNCNWVSHHVGYFATLEEAIAAREEATKRLHGEFARSG